MALFNRQIRAEVNRHKDALVIGGIVGAVAAGYSISQGTADLNAIAEAGKGLLDTALGRSTEVTQIAKIKLYGAFITVGSLAGYVISRILTSFGFKRRRR